MPKTEPTKLFNQYCSMMGRYGSNMPKDPKEYRSQMAQRPYEKISDFEKVMLFLAVREEKRAADEDASWIQFNYQGLARGYKIDGKLVKSELGFKKALENYIENAFTIDVAENETLLKSFRGTEYEQLVRDVGEILGKGKEINKGMSDPESVKRATQLSSLLKRFGYEAADLEKTEPKEVSGSAEYQDMVKKAFEAYRAARENRYEPQMGERIVDACITYNKGKKSVRMTESGRKRFDDSLNLMATFANLNDPKVKANIARINEVRKTKPGDRYFVDLARYGEEGRVDRMNAETLKSTRDKARAAVADLLTGEGARKAKAQYMQKNAEEKLNTYRSKENAEKRAAEMTKQGREHLTEVWAVEVWKNPPRATASRKKPEGERTAADVVCVHLAEAYQDYRSLKSITERHALMTDPKRDNSEAINDLFDKFKKNMTIAYTTMRLYQPDALMDSSDMMSVRSTSSSMCLGIKGDASIIDKLGGDLLSANGNAANILANLDSDAMKKMDTVFNIADPTGYVTGRSKTTDDFLENKPMTRAEHSKNLQMRGVEAAMQYKSLADFHPAGKPITEEMALARNFVAYSCVADKVMTAMYPEETVVPDMNAVRKKVETMVKNPDFADRLSVEKPGNDFGSRIETLCVEELSRIKATGPVRV